MWKIKSHEVRAPGAPGSQGHHSFFIFIAKINTFFFSTFFLSGKSHGVQAPGAPGAPGSLWAPGDIVKINALFFLNFFLCGKNLGFGPQGPQGPKGPHAFFIFILKINAFFFSGFFLCGNRHRARAQGAPGAPWASSNLTNRAGIRVKRHLQKPTISKIAYIIPQKMVFFQFSKMKLHYNAATLPLLKKLRPFHQIYTILMNIFWAAVYCIFTTSII